MVDRPAHNRNCIVVRAKHGRNKKYRSILVKPDRDAGLEEMELVPPKHKAPKPWNGIDVSQL